MIAHSDKIDQISAALVKAEASIGGAKKDAKNPHFKNEYATLASIVGASKGALIENGIVPIQSPGCIIEGAIRMTTRLLHESGQWIETTCDVPVGKRDPQGVGSTITYARRYALAAALNIPVVDDDAESAMIRGQAANEEPETIDSEQAIELERRIESLDANKAALLEYFKVDNLRQITPQQLKSAHASLDKKEREAKKPEAA
jgi:hypothetical protein